MNTNQISAILVFTVLEAVRARLWIFVLIVVATVYGLASFAAALSITESTDYWAICYAASIRMIGAFIIAAFVAGSVHREFDDRVFDLVISRALSRADWYLGKLLGYVILAAAFALTLSLPLLFKQSTNVMVWGLSLSMEFIILTGAALTFSITLRHVTVSITAVFGFYLLARSISAMVLMSKGAAVNQGSSISDAIVFIVDSLALLLPSLERFAVSNCLTAQDCVTDLPMVMLETLIYVGLLAGIGLFDLYRRNY